MFNNVTGIKKKFIVIVATIALVSFLLVFQSAQSDTNALESDPVQPSKTTESNISSLFANELNSPGTSGYDADSGELYFRILLAIVFILLLGVAALYVSKKVLPKISNMPGKEIHIVETAHLGPRKAVHLIEIGSRRYLIGSTNETISTLADLNPTMLDLSNQEVDINFEKANERQTY